jgi:hypothetical protein
MPPGGGMALGPGDGAMMMPGSGCCAAESLAAANKVAIPAAATAALDRGSRRLRIRLRFIAKARRFLSETGAFSRGPAHRFDGN